MYVEQSALGRVANVNTMHRFLVFTFAGIKTTKDLAFEGHSRIRDLLGHPEVSGMVAYKSILTGRRSEPHEKASWQPVDIPHIWQSHLYPKDVVITQRDKGVGWPLSPDGICPHCHISHVRPFFWPLFPGCFSI